MAQQINLYNPIFLKQKKYFSAFAMLQSLALLLGGILAFYGYARYEAQSLVRTAQDARRQADTQREQLARLTRDFSALGRSKLLEEETARMAARLKQREEMLGTLRTGGLGNAEGFAKYLAAFARHPMDGVWLTGLTIGGDGSNLLLNGRVLYADLVPAYIQVLNKEAVMRGRRVSELRMTAREEQPVATAVPGANAGNSPAPPPAPLKFIEFSVIASRGAAGAERVVPAGGPAAESAPATAPKLSDLVPDMKAAK